MKKNKRVIVIPLCIAKDTVIFLCIATLIFAGILMYYAQFNESNTASASSFSKIRITKMREMTDDMTAKEKTMITPLSYVFTDGTYKNTLEFYENELEGGFWSYITRSPETKRAYTDDYDFLNILENWQWDIGRNGEYLLDSSYSWNIKKGWSPSNGLTYSSTGAHMQVKSGDYKGTTNVEFRYIGYSSIGTIIGNPYFPADNSKSSLKFWDANWIEESWKSYPNLIEESPYSVDIISTDIVYDWWNNIVFKSKDGWQFLKVARKNGYTGKEAEYWANRLMFYTNPETGTGILIGCQNSKG